MKNRIKRLMVNGARKNLKKQAKQESKERKEAIKFELDEERDNAIEYRKERDLMAQRYNEWEKDFIGRPKTPAQVIDALQELGNIVNDTHRCSESLRVSTLDVIYQKLTMANEMKNIIDSATVKVIANCSICNHLHSPSDHIPLRVFQYQAFHLECGNCGSEIPAKECKMVKDLPRKK